MLSIYSADGLAEWVGPPTFTEALQTSASTVHRVAFGPSDGWLILCENGSAVWKSIPRRLHKQVHKMDNPLPKMFFSRALCTFIGFLP